MLGLPGWWARRAAAARAAARVRVVGLRHLGGGVVEVMTESARYGRRTQRVLTFPPHVFAGSRSPGD
jgi:hypothetical protein